MIRDPLVDGVARLQPPGLDQLGEEFGLVHDLVVAAEVRILVFQIVEAMRALRDDPARLVAIERLDILPGHGRVEIFVAEPARRDRRCSISSLPKIANFTPACFIRPANERLTF